MFNRIPLYVTALLFVAVIMTAGCATQEAVVKDEGITPARVTKPIDTSKSSATASNKEPIVPAKQPAAAQLSQKTSSSSQLQSALEKIYFNFDSADLSESARNTLTKNAQALLKAPSAKIIIWGNCDERGSAEYNLALSDRRAKAAQQYLVTLGVKADSISTISYGKEKPAVLGSNEAAWAKNRRDDFFVVSK